MKLKLKSGWSARRWWWLAVIFYSISLGLFSIWSFSLTDPNLVFTSWAPYWQSQTWLWKNIYADPVLQARLYVLFVSLVIASYGFLIYIFKRHPELVSGSSNGSRHAELVSASATFNKHLIFALAIIILPLLFSYNALSHDMFNYLFNAKMVVVYHTNPHAQVALDFAQDEWTRFMHNTHTPAPYWYGWTGISLIPYSLGLGKFTLSWWLFRLFSVLSWVGLWWSWHKWGQWRGQPVSTTWKLAIALLPLMLIEIIANGHNDLWMMVPAILSLGMILYRKLSWQSLVGSFALLLFSISIKYATAVLIPLWLLVAIARWLTSFCRHTKHSFTRHAELVSASSKESPTARHAELVSASSKHGSSHLSWRLAPLTQFLIQLSPLIASILLFIPLLTNRSQQFLPWYLSWSLVWIPLFAWNFRQSPTDRLPTKLNSHRLNYFLITFTKLWIAWLFALSISALFRYVPWLLAGGEYSEQLLTQQKWILWGGGVTSACLLFLLLKRCKFSDSSK